MLTELIRELWVLVIRLDYISRGTFFEDDNVDEYKEHKCYGCVWGTWTGLTFYCPFSN